jgi:hypothetical protein
MSTASELRTLALDDPVLSKKIERRMYHGQAPQRAGQKDIPLPYIVFTEISANQVSHLGNTAVNYMDSRWQFDCLAKTLTDAGRLQRDLRNAINGKRIGSIDFVRRESYHGDIDGLFEGQKGPGRTVADYQVWYEEEN